MTHSVNFPEDLFTSRWIQSNLTVHLQHHMIYSCRVCKYGTIIYSPYSDLILSLSQTLWLVHNIKSNNQYYANDHCSTDPCIPESSKVLDTSNLAIHSQINSLLAQDAKTPFEYDELDIDKFIQNMNKTLWNAICILTQSTSERQGLSKVTEPLTSSYHIKMLFFTL